MSLENLGFIELAGIGTFVGIAGAMVWKFKGALKSSKPRSLATKANPKPRYSMARKAGSRQEVYDERFQCWTFLDMVDDISEPFDFFGTGGRQPTMFAVTTPESASELEGSRVAHSRRRETSRGEPWQSPHSNDHTPSSWGGSSSSGDSSSSGSSSSWGGSCGGSSSSSSSSCSGE